MTVERNDVNISRLLFWGKEFIFYTVLKDEINVFMRLVGDADLNRSRTVALRRSAELRSKLKNKSSDESLAFLIDKDIMEKDKLIEIIILLSMRDFTQDAVREVDVPYPKEPKSDASLEKMEKYQAEVDNYPKLREEKIRKYLDKRAKDKRKELEKLDNTSLYSVYESTMINELCEREMIRVFRDACAFFGSHKDEDYKIKFFTSLEEFENLPTDMKNNFLNAYSELELPPEELKKLPEVTE